MSDEQDRCCANTDKEIWRERPGDYYADSIHVTEGGGIGINCGGYVYVKPVREWHKLAGGSFPPSPSPNGPAQEGTDGSAADPSQDLVLDMDCAGLHSERDWLLDIIKRARDRIIEQRSWWRCRTHGDQPQNTWGCPQCVVDLRAQLAERDKPPAGFTLSAGWVHDGDAALNPATGQRVPYQAHPPNADVLPTQDFAADPTTDELVREADFWLASQSAQETYPALMVLTRRLRDRVVEQAAHIQALAASGQGEG